MGKYGIVNERSVKMKQKGKDEIKVRLNDLVYKPRDLQQHTQDHYDQI